jgi:hypothetical protein
MGPNHLEASWDARALSGRVTWYAPPHCVDGEPSGAPEEFAYLYVPRVKLSPQFEERTWKTVSLEGCSAFVDGTAGFTVAGLPSTAKDSSMRVLARERPVRRAERRRLSKAATWTLEDHLELWVSDTEATYDTHCLDERPMSLIQFGIRLGDGKVFSGFGAPAVTALRRVERAASAGWAGAAEDRAT